MGGVFGLLPLFLMERTMATFDFIENDGHPYSLAQSDGRNGKREHILAVCLSEAPKPPQIKDVGLDPEAGPFAVLAMMLNHSGRIEEGKSFWQWLALTKDNKAIFGEHLETIGANPGEWVLVVERTNAEEVV